jgi:hypothetical protein
VAAATTGAARKPRSDVRRRYDHGPNRAQE